MSSAPRCGGGYGGLLGTPSASSQYRSSSKGSGGSYLGIVVGISAMSIFCIFIIYYMLSSPVKFDEAEAEALTKFIVRSLGDALPDPPPSAAAEGGSNNNNDQKNSGGGGPVFVFGFSETDDNVASTAAGISRAYSDLITAGHASSSVKVLLYDVLNDGSPPDTLEHHLPNYLRNILKAHLQQHLHRMFYLFSKYSLLLNFPHHFQRASIYLHLFC